MIGCFDFRLDILHFFISLHRELHLVSVQRAEDETQPEWTEHISPGKFYSDLIVKNSMLKQTHITLINSISTQYWLCEFMVVNKRKTIFSLSFHSVDIISFLSYATKKKKKKGI